jgi:hypothetical protein
VIDFEDTHYHMRTREETCLTLIYRLPMCMTWGECLIADERKVHQNVRQRVNWLQQWHRPLSRRPQKERDRPHQPES